MQSVLTVHGTRTAGGTVTSETFVHPRVLSVSDCVVQHSVAGAQQWAAHSNHSHLSSSVHLKYPAGSIHGGYISSGEPVPSRVLSSGRRPRSPSVPSSVLGQNQRHISASSSSSSPSLSTASDKLRQLLREPVSTRVRVSHPNVIQTENQPSRLSLVPRRLCDDVRSHPPEGSDLMSELQKHLKRGLRKEDDPTARGLLKLRTDAVRNWIRKTQSDRDRRAEEVVSSFTCVRKRDHQRLAHGALVQKASSRRESVTATGTSYRRAYPPPGERAIAALARGTVLRPTPIRMDVSISTQSCSGPVKIPLCGDLRCRVRSCYTWPRMYSCFLSGELQKVGVEIDAVVHAGHPIDLRDTNENASRPSVIRTSHSQRQDSSPRSPGQRPDPDPDPVRASPPQLSPAESRLATPAVPAPVRSPNRSSSPASSSDEVPLEVAARDEEDEVDLLKEAQQDMQTTTISCAEGTLTLYRGTDEPLGSHPPRTTS